jgi:hypothetical protein
MQGFNPSAFVGQLLSLQLLAEDDDLLSELRPEAAHRIGAALAVHTDAAAAGAGAALPMASVLAHCRGAGGPAVQAGSHLPAVTVMEPAVSMQTQLVACLAVVRLLPTSKRQQALAAAAAAGGQPVATSHHLCCSCRRRWAAALQGCRRPRSHGCSWWLATTHPQPMQMH